MKLSIFLLTILFSVGYQDSIPDTINKAIEELREAIPEPISIESINPDLSDNEYVSGYFNISNLSVQGLKAFNVNVTYILNILPRHFVLTIDSVILDLDDSFDVTFFDVSLLHLYGEGKTRVELTNFTVEANLSLSLVPTLNLTINGMQMHLDGAKFAIDGIFNDEDWSGRFSDLLTNNVANMVNDQEHGLSGLLEDALNKIIADLISGNDTLSERSNDYAERKPEIVLQAIAETLFSPLISALSKTN